MPEQQNTEYKQGWHDDYLKWVCGFANAQGGRIYIGKDDTGKIVGLEDYKKQIDEIPNKIKSHMGITAEVNLLQKSSKRFIEIIVPPYSVPISLRGRYYYRSGSVKQELTGTALNEFLLKRTGQTWDNVIEPRATFADIDEKTFNSYLEMSKEKTSKIPLTSPNFFSTFGFNVSLEQHNASCPASLCRFCGALCFRILPPSQ